MIKRVKSVKYNSHYNSIAININSSIYYKSWSFKAWFGTCNKKLLNVISSRYPQLSYIYWLIHFKYITSEAQVLYLENPSQVCFRNLFATKKMFFIHGLYNNYI